MPPQRSSSSRGSLESWMQQTWVASRARPTSRALSAAFELQRLKTTTMRVRGTLSLWQSSHALRAEATEEGRWSTTMR